MAGRLGLLLVLGFVSSSVASEPDEAVDASTPASTATPAPAGEDKPDDGAPSDPEEKPAGPGSTSTESEPPPPPPATPPPATPPPATPPPATPPPAGPVVATARQSSTSVEVRELRPNLSQEVFTIDLRPPSTTTVIDGGAGAEPYEPEAWDASPAGPVAGPIVREGFNPSGSVEMPDPVNIQVRHKEFPDYPDALEVLYGDRVVRCVARAWIDDKGVPQRVSVYDCPPGFHLATAEAVQDWRWAHPDQAVPEEGLPVDAVVGFVRKDRKFYPGVTYLRDPREITADPSRSVLVRSGALPEYPDQVSHGDAVCIVELTVTRGGGAKDMLVDGCAAPYRFETSKAVAKWKWYPEVHDGIRTESTLNFGIVFRLEQSPTGELPWIAPE